MQDFFFHYKYVGRYIFFLKNSKELYHFSSMLNLDKLLIYFNLKNITDLNSLSISNYYYFFKYYFGKIPFFYSYSHQFKLNVNYYSFIIQCVFKEKYTYYLIFFLINDILFLISKNAILIKKEKNFWEYIINDMNFFIEKKKFNWFF